MDTFSSENDFKLVISPALAQKMDRALILTEDARRTISYCQSTRNKLLDNATGDFIGHLRWGALTYWVRYRPHGDAYLLLNIYCHRAKIVGDNAQ